MGNFQPELTRQPGTPAPGRGGSTVSTAELASIIDEASKGAPTFSQLLARLEGLGVTPLLSVNARGLNGMSYEFRGQTVKGSDIGRAYTAQGLQARKRVQYSPERDDAAIRSAVERGRATREPMVVDREKGSRIRDARSGLSADQRETLNEIGRFRTIGVHDLIEHRYGSVSSEFAQDMRVLREGGFAERRTAAHPKSGKTYNVVVLTAKGRRAAQAAAKRNGSGQQFYAGLVKSAEIRHDIGIYRMYQRERARLKPRAARLRESLWISRSRNG